MFIAVRAHRERIALQRRVGLTRTCIELHPGSWLVREGCLTASSCMRMYRASVKFRLLLDIYGQSLAYKYKEESKAA